MLVTTVWLRQPITPMLLPMEIVPETTLTLKPVPQAFNGSLRMIKLSLKPFNKALFPWLSGSMIAVSGTNTVAVTLMHRLVMALRQSTMQLPSSATRTERATGSKVRIFGSKAPTTSGFHPLKNNALLQLTPSGFLLPKTTAAPPRDGSAAETGAEITPSSPKTRPSAASQAMKATGRRELLSSALQVSPATGSQESQATGSQARTSGSSHHPLSGLFRTPGAPTGASMEPCASLSSLAPVLVSASHRSTSSPSKLSDTT